MQFYSKATINEQLNQQLCWSEIISLEEEQFEGEILEFVGYLKSNPQSSIYLSWIEGNKGLHTFLTKGSADRNFKDEQRLLEHSQVKGLISFVTPFIQAPLIKAARELDTMGLTYLVVCANDERMVIESLAYDQLKQLFVPANEVLDKKIGEDAFIEKIQPILTDEVLRTINTFSRSSYALKVKYVDSVLNFLKAESCTVRLANWILKRLETLQLNTEHQEKFAELRRELKQGELSVKNTNTRKGISFSPKIVGVITLVGIICGFVYWLIAYKPLSDPEKINIANNSSFQTFTEDERKELDSLLKEMQPNRAFNLDELEMDVGQYLNEQIELVLRAPFNNEIAEQYFEDLKRDLEIVEAMGLPKTCKPIDQPEDNLPDQMVRAEFKTVGTESVFRNESSYDVLLIAFKDYVSAPVFATYLKSGQEATIYLEDKDKFFVVPGVHYAKYVKPKTLPKDKTPPSINYSHHFCEWDRNVVHGMNTVYEVQANSLDKYKFLIDGNPNVQLEVLDLDNVVEVH